MAIFHGPDTWGDRAEIIASLMTYIFDYLQHPLFLTPLQHLCFLTALQHPFLIITALPYLITVLQHSKVGERYNVRLNDMVG